MNTGLFSINFRDLAKGLVTAVLAGVITYIYGIVQTGSLQFDYHQILTVCLASALGYITKQYLSDANGRFVGHI